MNSFTTFAVMLLGLTPMVVSGQREPVAPSAPVSVQKIWDAGLHNAFTDLIRFQERWFCTFREGEGHVGGNGRIRLLVSETGGKWESAALLSEAGTDLRDPKLSITPDRQLMLTLGGSVYEGKTLTERQPRVAFSQDGRQWTAPKRVAAKDDWLWRVTWHQGRAYGIAYTVPVRRGAASPTEWTVKLLSSTNGVNYELVTLLDVPGRPNEATLQFLENGDCVALLRREGADAKAEKDAWIGVSRAPYQDWKWTPAGMFVGGPNFVVLSDGTMLAGGRQVTPAAQGPRMFVGPMTLQSITPRWILPSGGDCSYPGMVWHDGLLWVSYYSSHEGKSSIYLAKLPRTGLDR
jgi:hypothetical protein